MRLKAVSLGQRYNLKQQGLQPFNDSANRCFVNVEEHSNKLLSHVMPVIHKENHDHFDEIQLAITTWTLVVAGNIFFPKRPELFYNSVEFTDAEAGNMEKNQEVLADNAVFNHVK
jgi:hypothetical protein